MGNSIVNAVLKSPKIASLIILFILCLQIVLSLSIQKNTSPYFIGIDHPSRMDELGSYNVFNRSRDTALVLLTFPETGIFDNQVVSLLEEIDERLNDIDLLEIIDLEALSVFTGIDISMLKQRTSSKESAIDLYNELIKKYESSSLDKLFASYLYPLRSIKSLYNTDNVYAELDEIYVQPNFEKKPDNLWPDHLKHDLLHNPLFVNSMVSKDGKSLVVSAESIIHEENAAANQLILKKLKAVVEKSIHNIPGLQVSAHYAGVPVVNDAISEVMEEDNATFFPLVIAVVILLLIMIYRSLKLAMLCAVIAVCSIVMTMGLIPIFGFNFNIVTTILPVFIITIAITDAIHVISDVRSRPNVQGHSNISESISKLFRPMLITSVTTSVGFFSLSLSEIDNIRSFGVLVGFSVLIAFVLSITLLPILLSKISLPELKEEKRNAFSTITNSMATKSRWLVAVIIICLPLAFWGLPSVYVDQASIKAFDEDKLVRTHNEEFIEAGYGTVPISVWFRAEEQNGILQHSLLSAIESAETLLSEHPDVANHVSILDFFDRMHQALEGPDNPLDLRETDRLKQYLLFLESGAEKDIEAILDGVTHSNTRIVISMKDDSSAIAGAVINELQSHFDSASLDGVEILYTSYGAETVNASNEVVDTQLTSIVVTFILITSILLFATKSIILSIVGLIPLAMTLIIMFSIMGIFDFSIDIGSSVVAGIALGVGIDYSVHLIEAIKRSLHIGNPQQTIVHALGQVIRPITISAFVISSGFSLLMLSGFQSLASMGLLITVAMIVAAIFSLFVLPRLFLLKDAYLYRKCFS
jgi:predicted RND superfamily exporter protein